MELKQPLTSREDLIYETLKENILNGQLKPNEILNQTEIARMLGVSIIPVRTAINRLVAEGWLKQDAYHSPQVLAYSEAELDEALVICSQLEILATRTAIPRVNEEQLKLLKDLTDTLEQAVKDNQLLTFARINRLFHLALYKCCPYPRLVSMITDLLNKADIHRYHSMYDLVPGLAEHAMQEHRELYSLIEQKDVEGAVKLMEAHKAYSRQCFLVAYENIYAEMHTRP
jgi:DNA-binding GntR family transcriptional regulator